MSKSKFSTKKAYKISKQITKEKYKDSGRSALLKSDSKKRAWRNYKRERRARTFGILGVILLFLLVINFARQIRTGHFVTFRSLLNWLGEVDSFGMTKYVSAWTIRGDWGIIDGLRKFFNMFGDIFGVLFFMFSNLIGSIRFVLQFIAFVFA